MLIAMICMCHKKRIYFYDLLQHKLKQKYHPKREAKAPIEGKPGLEGTERRLVSDNPLLVPATQSHKGLEVSPLRPVFWRRGDLVFCI